MSLCKNNILPRRPTIRKRNHHTEWLRTKARLLVRKAFLIIKLGGECRNCKSKENLEFDHPDGKTWEARKFSPQMRMKRYEQDYENGQLSLLCKKCNGTDGALNKYFYSAIQHNKEIPF